MSHIDLRSDTVTQPTQGMRDAMIEAEVGDDVYQDDPSVNQLEQFAAELFGFEAALYAPSGTQTNLIALLAHCGRGDEYIVGQSAHTYLEEGGGAAVLGGIQPQPLIQMDDGTLDLDAVAGLIKPRDFHFARTKLLCLENTTHGKPLPLAYVDTVRRFCDHYKLRLHLDGARVCNAAVSHGVEVSAIAGRFDSVSVCLSKGLGAPVGSVLCGSTEFIDEARRWRKMVGGGMRQAGFIAAAGLYALQNHVARLQEDHDNAERMRAGLAAIDELNGKVTGSTNMVFIDLPLDVIESLATFCRARGIELLEEVPLRLVTHIDISSDDVDATVKAMEEFFSSRVE